MNPCDRCGHALNDHPLRYPHAGCCRIEGCLCDGYFPVRWA